MKLIDKVNTNKSVLGQDILDWISSPKSSKTEEEQKLSSKLYHKYVSDKTSHIKGGIQPDAYYFVNHNHPFNSEICMAYVVRDREKSPKPIPRELQELNIINTGVSFRGSLIQEWAYYQKSAENSPYREDGESIIKNYFDKLYPIKPKVYYFLYKSDDSIRVIRDIKRSPRCVTVNGVGFSYEKED